MNQLRITGVRLRDEVVSGAGRDDLFIAGSTFRNCTFEGFALQNASFGTTGSPSRFIGCRFIGLTTQHSTVGRASFKDSQFEHVDLEGWISREASFVGCTFSGRLVSSVLHASVRLVHTNTLVANKISNNDFSSCRLDDFTFRGGVDIRMQRLPTGQRYAILPDLPGALKVLRHHVDVTPIAQETLGGLVGFWQEVADAGQHSYFTDSEALTPDAGPWVDDLEAAGLIIRSTESGWPDW